jgi:hypothetical protein
LTDTNATLSTSSFIGDPLTKFIAEQRAKMPAVDNNGRVIHPVTITAPDTEAGQ